MRQKVDAFGVGFGYDLYRTDGENVGDDDVGENVGDDDVGENVGFLFSVSRGSIVAVALENPCSLSLLVRKPKVTVLFMELDSDSRL